MSSTDKQHAPSAARNREPIARVLERILPHPIKVLEIASGSGEHAVYFAEQIPWLSWQPTEREPDRIASIEAWRQESGLSNVAPAMRLDVLQQPWPVDEAGAIFCSNMIHIAPWEATEGLIRGAAKVLPSGGLLILYGPFREGDRHTAESNRRFDEELKAKDPSWGVRDRFEVEALARGEGLILQELVPMPANNMILVFENGVPYR